MKIRREVLLASLESVTPGLAKQEQIEQTTSLVFKDSKVMTFNEDIACVGPSGLDKALRGAVKADKLLDLLRKLPDSELTIKFTDKSLIIRGKSRRATLSLDPEVVLPIDVVEQPEDWRKLDEEFLDACRMAAQCSGSDESDPVLCCVHVHQDHVEAFDGHQMLRYLVDTGVSEPFLVRRDAARHVAGMGLSEVSESTNWVHFRHGDLSLSCRRIAEPFAVLDNLIDEDGCMVELPEGLGTAALIADTFSSENPDYNLVEIALSAGSVKVIGKGVSGVYEELVKVEYSGPAINFLIAPYLLDKITKEHKQARISAGKLTVCGGAWTYISLLQDPNAGAAVEEEFD